MKSALWQKKSEYFVPVTNPHEGGLPSGAYKAVYSVNDALWYYSQVETSTDDLVRLPGLPIDFILNQIKKFWDSAEEYKKYGFLQKRGVLLYGPPGCGKSSLVALIRNQLLAEKKGVCFMPDDSFSSLGSAIKSFRRLEPERPIMTLVEDIETLLESSNANNNAINEKAALSFYDGENQVNNVLHIATTNKPDVIADRFIRRPGRFDIVIGVHNPTRETRHAYLEHICNGQLSDTQRENILDKTEGLSLAYLREIASTYLVLGIPLDDTITRLQAQAKAKYHTSKTGFTIGFTENA